MDRPRPPAQVQNTRQPQEMPRHAVRPEGRPPRNRKPDRQPAIRRSQTRAAKRNAAVGSQNTRRRTREARPVTVEKIEVTLANPRINTNTYNTV